MAVGVMYAGLLSGSADISAGGALALALGIAIQNVPEGAIISMPLHAEGKSKSFSFLGGVISGAVEPLGAVRVRLAVGGREVNAFQRARGSRRLARVGADDERRDDRDGDEAK